MKVIRVKGGLGNQLFQYALAKEYEWMGYRVCMDVSSYEGYFRSFQLDLIRNNSIRFINSTFWRDSSFYNIARKIYRRLGWYVIENEQLDFDKRVNNINAHYIDGYFQGEKYFEDVRNEIKRIEFKDVNSSLASAKNEIIQHSNSVSIHFRRGDYLSLQDEFGGICTDEYYNRAIDTICSKISNPLFYVFSDDIEWGIAFMKNRGLPYRFFNKSSFENYQDWFDLLLMSSCENNIIANSSFGWWAAWLNSNPDKIVICPNKWNNITNKRMQTEQWIEIASTAGRKC